MATIMYAVLFEAPEKHMNKTETHVLQWENIGRLVKYKIFKNTMCLDSKGGTGRDTYIQF